MKKYQVITNNNVILATYDKLNLAQCFIIGYNSTAKEYKASKSEKAYIKEI